MTNLNNQQIESKFFELVKSERAVLVQLLSYICEIETRKIHIAKGYPSLFEYLTKLHCYSPAAAMRRIAAARLLREIPICKEKIRTGELNLSQMALAHQMFKMKKIPTSQQQSIIEQIAGKTQSQTELILVRALDIQRPTQEKASLHQDESVTLTIPLSKAQMQLLKEVQSMESHSVASGKWSDLIAHVFENFLRMKKKPAKVRQQLQPSERKSVTPALRQQVFKKFQHCQYKDPRTGQTCGSTYQLQIEHTKPKWAGGSNDPSNLTVLCGTHNRFRYSLQSGTHPPNLPASFG